MPHYVSGVKPCVTFVTHGMRRTRIPAQYATSAESHPRHVSLGVWQTAQAVMK